MDVPRRLHHFADSWALLPVLLGHLLDQLAEVGRGVLGEWDRVVLALYVQFELGLRHERQLAEAE